MCVSQGWARSIKTEKWKKKKKDRGATRKLHDQDLGPDRTGMAKQNGGELGGNFLIQMKSKNGKEYQGGGEQVSLIGR